LLSQASLPGWLGLAAACLALGASAAPAQGAGGYPAKPVRIVLSSPGGGTYIMTHLLADQLERSLGAPFVVESRQPNIAASTYVAKAPADGYTLLVATATYIVSSLLHRTLPYDPMRDFAPITQLGRTPIIIVVHPSLPVRTIADLVKLAKARPGELNFGSGGLGSPLHLAGELFNQITGVKIVHVPFRGTANAATDLEAGRVQVMYPSALSVLPQIKAGRLRPIAFMGTQRSSELPQVPTTAESGYPKLVADIWYGFLAPRGTPESIVTQLNRAATDALHGSDMKARMLGAGVEPVASTPSEFAAFTRNERDRWQAVITKAGIPVGP
jgi:tripartite-type tricarboxylate transporter receptor subunit TctC